MDFSAIEDIAIEAGAAILSHRPSIQINEKSDGSPVTNADLAANQIIADGLKNASPHPTLSEESLVPWKDRKDWRTFWLVDPLDGTKEYISGHDDFTVNIALIKDGAPQWGVVFAPALNQIYSGGINLGATKNGTAISTSTNSPPTSAAVSRSHLSLETSDFCTSNAIENTRPTGSSLKFCKVSGGEVDLYPRFAPTSEWDTAAGHAILEGAGGVIRTIPTLGKLQYNKENILNPSFIACSSQQALECLTW